MGIKYMPDIVASIEVLYPVQSQVTLESNILFFEGKGQYKHLMQLRIALYVY